MVAAKHNFKMEQGATFARTFTLSNEDGSVLDLSDYLARMQIKAHLADSTSIIDMYSPSNYISVDGTNGSIALSIPATVTSTFAFDTAIYDFELEDSTTGIVTRLLQGSVKLSLNVTR